MIFHYSQEKGIPLVGLNIQRTIIRQVSQRGFQSLSKEERGKLPNMTCAVDDDYMDFIRRAYGAHAHGRKKSGNAPITNTPGTGTSSFALFLEHAHFSFIEI